MAKNMERKVLMLKVSSRGRYALRLMIDLALHDGENCVALRDISKRQEISEKYLEQVISPLNRAGLLKSARGSRGGYHLARPPEDYTVGEILEAAENCRLVPVACMAHTPNRCPRYSSCSTITFWEELYAHTKSFLYNKRLSDFLKDADCRVIKVKRQNQSKVEAFSEGRKSMNEGEEKA